MRLALRFWGRLAIWAGSLLLLLAAISLASGQGVAEVIAHMPAWAALAIALAAYPAGAAVSGETFPDRRLVPRRVIEITLAAAAVSVLMLTLGNYVGPRASRWLSSDGMGAVPEPAHMLWGELRRAAKDAVMEARTATGPEAVRKWQRANRLVWHYVRRTDGSSLPLLFGLIGVLAGFWSGLTRRRDLRQTQLWAMGLFLLMSTYLAGENGYEMIVLQSAGPVFFAGDLVLVTPILLLIGLGWPTLITLRRRATNGGDPWDG